MRPIAVVREVERGEGWGLGVIRSSSALQHNARGGGVTPQRALLDYNRAAAAGVAEWSRVLRDYFKAFQSPGYRWLWFNAMGSSAGFTAILLAQGWLLLDLTGSAFWVGVAGGLRGAGQLVFALPGGALADRFDRRRLLMGAQALAVAEALGLGLLVLTTGAQVWQVLALGFMGGASIAVSQPAMRSLEYDVVGATRLLNAGAFRFLGTSVVQIASALAAGLAIERLGTDGAYLLGAGAMTLAVAAVLPLRVSRAGVASREPFLEAMRQGLRYAACTPAVRRLLLFSLVVEMFGFSYLYMIPVVARNVLGLGASGLGFLSAMRGVGQLVSMVLVAALGDFRYKQHLVTGAALGFGIFVALFGLSPYFTASLVLIACASAMAGAYDSAMVTLVQTTASAEMRGRVVGLYVSTWGMNQLGSFGLGGIGTVLSVPLALAMSGGVVAASALVRLRHGYRARSEESATQ